MNNITYSNYQMSFRMKECLKPAEKITRKVKNVYPHISPFNMQKFDHSKRSMDNNKFFNYLKDLQMKLIEFRHVLAESRSPHKDLVDELKNGLRLANGGEEVELASTIGRINGQKNIYSASVDGVDHAVCFITNAPVKEGKSQILKGKDAIIIDPQLGITDFANNYFAKIKEALGKYHFKKGDLSVTPFKNQLNDEQVIQNLKENYPELLIKDYKEIKV